jgi:hypothetical protein
MDNLKFTVTSAGDTFPGGMPGTFVYFQEITVGSTATSRIKVRTNNGDICYLRPGQGKDLPPFNALEVTRDAGSATITGELAIGDGTFTDNRLSGAVTATIDATERIADNADGQAAAGAAGFLGVVARLQAWNGATWDRIATVTVNAVKTLAVQAAGTLGALAQVAIGGINALIVTERGFTYGAAYVSSTSKAANTPEQVFSTAANVNGAIVWRAGFSSVDGGVTQAQKGYIAKTGAAPLSVIDGDCIAQADNYYQNAAATNMFSLGKLERHVFVSAGKGLWFISANAELNAHRHVLYTLL